MTYLNPSWPEWLARLDRLSTHTKNAIHAERFDSLQEVLDATDKELLAIPMFGKLALQQVRSYQPKTPSSRHKLEQLLRDMRQQHRDTEKMIGWMREEFRVAMVALHGSANERESVRHQLANLQRAMIEFETRLNLMTPRREP